MRPITERKGRLRRIGVDEDRNVRYSRRKSSGSSFMVVRESMASFAVELVVRARDKDEDRME